MDYMEDLEKLIDSFDAPDEFQVRQQQTVDELKVKLGKAIKKIGQAKSTIKFKDNELAKLRLEHEQLLCSRDCDRDELSKLRDEQSYVKNRIVSVEQEYNNLYVKWQTANSQLNPYKEWVQRHGCQEEFDEEMRSPKKRKKAKNMMIQNDRLTKCNEKLQEKIDSLLIELGMYKAKEELATLSSQPPTPTPLGPPNGMPLGQQSLRDSNASYAFSEGSDSCYLSSVPEEDSFTTCSDNDNNSEKITGINYFMRYQHAQKELATKQTEIDRLETKLREIESFNGELKVKNDDLRGRNVEIKAELDGLRKILQHHQMLERNLAGLKEEYRNELQGLEIEKNLVIDDLKTQLDSLTRQHELNKSPELRNVTCQTEDKEDPCSKCDDVQMRANEENSRVSPEDACQHHGMLERNLTDLKEEYRNKLQGLEIEKNLIIDDLKAQLDSLTRQQELSKPPELRNVTCQTEDEEDPYSKCDDVQMTANEENGRVGPEDACQHHGMLERNLADLKEEYKNKFQGLEIEKNLIIDDLKAQLDSLTRQHELNEPPKQRNVTCQTEDAEHPCSKCDDLQMTTNEENGRVSPEDACEHNEMLERNSASLKEEHKNELQRLELEKKLIEDDLKAQLDSLSRQHQLNKPPELRNVTCQTEDEEDPCSKCDDVQMTANEENSRVSPEDACQHHGMLERNFSDLKEEYKNKLQGLEIEKKLIIDDLKAQLDGLTRQHELNKPPEQRNVTCQTENAEYSCSKCDDLQMATSEENGRVSPEDPYTNEFVELILKENCYVFPLWSPMSECTTVQTQDVDCDDEEEDISQEREDVKSPSVDDSGPSPTVPGNNAEDKEKTDEDASQGSITVSSHTSKSNNDAVFTEKPQRESPTEIKDTLQDICLSHEEPNTVVEDPARLRNNKEITVEENHPSGKKNTLESICLNLDESKSVFENPGGLPNNKEITVGEYHTSVKKNTPESICVNHKEPKTAVEDPARLPNNKEKTVEEYDTSGKMNALESICVNHEETKTVVEDPAHLATNKKKSGEVYHPSEKINTLERIRDNYEIPKIVVEDPARLPNNKKKSGEVYHPSEKISTLERIRDNYEIPKIVVEDPARLPNNKKKSGEVYHPSEKISTLERIRDNYEIPKIVVEDPARLPNNKKKSGEVYHPSEKISTLERIRDNYEIPKIVVEDPARLPNNKEKTVEEYYTSERKNMLESICVNHEEPKTVEYPTHLANSKEKFGEVYHPSEKINTLERIRINHKEPKTPVEDPARRPNNKEETVEEYYTTERKDPLESNCVGHEEPRTVVEDPARLANNNEKSGEVYHPSEKMNTLERIRINHKEPKTAVEDPARLPNNMEKTIQEYHRSSQTLTTDSPKNLENSPTVENRRRSPRKMKHSSVQNESKQTGEKAQQKSAKEPDSLRRNPKNTSNTARLKAMLSGLKRNQIANINPNLYENKVEDFEEYPMAKRKKRIAHSETELASNAANVITEVGSDINSRWKSRKMERIDYEKVIPSLDNLNTNIEDGTSGSSSAKISSADIFGIMSRGISSIERIKSPNSTSRVLRRKSNMENETLLSDRSKGNTSRSTNQIPTAQSYPPNVARLERMDTTSEKHVTSKISATVCDSTSQLMSTFMESSRSPLAVDKTVLDDYRTTTLSRRSSIETPYTKPQCAIRKSTRLVNRLNSSSPAKDSSPAESKSARQNKPDVQQNPAFSTVDSQDDTGGLAMAIPKNNRTSAENAKIVAVIPRRASFEAMRLRSSVLPTGNGVLRNCSPAVSCLQQESVLPKCKLTDDMLSMHPTTTTTTTTDDKDVDSIDQNTRSREDYLESSALPSSVKGDAIEVRPKTNSGDGRLRRSALPNSIGNHLQSSSLPTSRLTDDILSMLRETTDDEEVDTFHGSASSGIYHLQRSVIPNEYRSGSIDGPRSPSPEPCAKMRTSGLQGITIPLEKIPIQSDHSESRTNKDNSSRLLIRDEKECLQKCVLSTVYSSSMASAITGRDTKEVHLRSNSDGRCLESCVLPTEHRFTSFSDCPRSPSPEPATTTLTRSIGEVIIPLEPDVHCDHTKAETSSEEPYVGRIGGLQEKCEDELMSVDSDGELSDTEELSESYQEPAVPVKMKEAKKAQKIKPMNQAFLSQHLDELLNLSSAQENVDRIVELFKTHSSTHIARAILQKLISKDIGEQIEKDKRNPNIPPLTQIERTLLGFIIRLDRNRSSSIFRNDKEDSVCEILLESMKEKLIRMAIYCTTQVDSNSKVAISGALTELSPLTRFYLSLCKSKQDIHSVRMLCCDYFYFGGDLAIPFFFVVLTGWPEVLPRAEDAEDIPLARVLIQIIYLKDCKQPCYNLICLRDLLIKYYGYPSERWDSDELFRELWNRYLDNPVRSADFALLLLCQNHPSSQWVYQQIRKHVIPIVERINSENFKASVIILVGNLSHRFKSTKKDAAVYLNDITTWLGQVLYTESESDVVRQSVSLCLKRLRNK